MSKQVLQTNVATLQGKLAIGQIPLDITTAKIIAADAIGNTTEGLFPDGNTAPSLARVNAAVDKALRVAWAAAGVAELQFSPVPLPRDLDNTAPMVVHLLMGKDANANSFAVAVSAWFGAGDANAGGNTAAVAAAAVSDYTVTLAAADVLPYPIVENEYKNGESQRAVLANNSRKRWRLTKRLTASQLATLRDFYVARNGATEPFYFYDPYDTVPRFSYDPTGQALNGRYIVRFAADWQQSCEPGRSEVQIELLELA